MNWKINDVMNKYNLSQRNKIKDFLISEINDENLNETIDFVNSDSKKQKKYFVTFFITALMKQMLSELKKRGYHKASLAV